MALSDHYVVVMQGTYLEQVVNNRWVFYQNSPRNGDNANPLANKLALDFIGDITQYQNEEFTWESVSVTNWDNPTELGFAGLSGADGEVAGTPMPSWVTYTTLFNRAGAGYRYPQKRLAGVDETLTDGNSIATLTAAGITAIMDNFCRFNDANGVEWAYIAVNKLPPIGSWGGSGLREQFPLTAIRTQLGSQRTRRP